MTLMSKFQKSVTLDKSDWLKVNRGLLEALELPGGVLVRCQGASVMTWIPDLSINDGKLVKKLQ